jgi:hypothetical protein
MLKKYMNEYFNNINVTEFFQVVVAFTIGVVLSPWNNGLLLFIIYLIINEIIYYIGTGGKYPFWTLEGRIAVAFSSIFGFIVGRSVVGFKDPIEDKKPTTEIKLKPKKAVLVRVALQPVPLGRSAS